MSSFISFKSEKKEDNLKLSGSFPLSGSYSKEHKIDIKERYKELEETMNKINDLIKNNKDIMIPLEKKIIKNVEGGKKYSDEELEFLSDDDISDSDNSDSKKTCYKNPYVKKLQEKLIELQELSVKEIGTMSIGTWKITLHIPLNTFTTEGKN